MHHVPHFGYGTCAIDIALWLVQELREELPSLRAAWKLWRVGSTCHSWCPFVEFLRLEERHDHLLCGQKIAIAKGHVAQVLHDRLVLLHWVSRLVILWTSLVLGPVREASARCLYTDRCLIHLVRICCICAVVRSLPLTTFRLLNLGQVAVAKYLIGTCRDNSKVIPVQGCSDLRLRALV